MRGSRVTRTLVAVLAVVTTLVTLVPAAEAQKRGGTLTIVRPTDPVSLDPNLETTAPGAWVYFNMLEGLLTLDDKKAELKVDKDDPGLSPSFQLTNGVLAVVSDDAEAKPIPIRLHLSPLREIAGSELRDVCGVEQLAVGDGAAHVDLDLAFGRRGVGGLRLSLEGRGAVLKELLLPQVELSRLNAMPVAQLRDRHPIDQVLFDDGHFLLRAEVPTLP